METEELKDLILRSLERDLPPGSLHHKLEEAGVSYRFKDGFTELIIERLISGDSVLSSESEFFSNMRLAFYRVALTGIAAIILLLISMLLGQGTLSLDSVLGLGNLHDESIICLMTGN